VRHEVEAEDPRMAVDAAVGQDNVETLRFPRYAARGTPHERVITSDSRLFQDRRVVP
jgi:hypothetical protein